ncbi:hypothetical protein MSPP1_003841 [Malassezia sp. CBS 17886]|nr:hypothetical protein MSPP1_003841 [Malassezia sp. CBS 17886]
MRRIVQAGVFVLGAVSVSGSAVQRPGAVLQTADPTATIKPPPTRTLGKRSAFSGTATWYDVETWVDGACGTHINNNMHIVALNEPMYGNLDAHSSWCGRHVMINNGLKTLEAVIMDACPETKQCHYGSLDMSMSLFEEFHDLELGVFPITWWTTGGRGGGGGASASGPSSSRGGSKLSAQASASRASEASAASASSASAVSAASSDAREQSKSRASASSVQASRASVSSGRASRASVASESRASVASDSRVSKQSRSSVSSRSSMSSSRSSSSAAASASLANSGEPPPGAGTGGSSNDTSPQAGNLQNFVRVLNGFSMLVHAAGDT